MNDFRNRFPRNKKRPFGQGQRPVTIAPDVQIGPNALTRLQQLAAVTGETPTQVLDKMLGISFMFARLVRDLFPIGMGLQQIESPGTGMPAPPKCVELIEGKPCGENAVGVDVVDGVQRFLCGDHVPFEEQAEGTAEERLAKLREEPGLAQRVDPSRATSSEPDPDETVPMRDEAPVEGEPDR